MTIRALLVDDESHALTALQQCLKVYEEIDILGCAENGIEAVKQIHEQQPDVVFLDVQMPKLDGFDVLELLGDEAPWVVFVTAYDEFAVKAFENNAVDYLLKPVCETRLAKTVQRLMERFEHRTTQARDPQVASHLKLEAVGPMTRILIREKGDVTVVPVDDVIAIEAADDYVVIHTLTHKFIKQDRLARFEAELNPQQFCRIHRSSIINLDCLESIETEGKDTRFANIKGGKQLAVSRSGYARLVERL